MGYDFGEILLMCGQECFDVLNDGEVFYEGERKI